MKKNIITSLLISLAIFVIFPLISAHTSPLLVILQFKSDKANYRNKNIVRSRILSSIRSRKFFRIKTTKTPINLQYPYSNSEKEIRTILSEYIKISKKLKCTHILAGHIYSWKNKTIISTKLFSAKKKDFIFSTKTITLKNEKISRASLKIIKNISLFMNGKKPYISKLVINSVSSPGKISLSWKSSVKCNKIFISRSHYKFGPFTKIGISTSNIFTDDNAEVGLKYWYKIRGMKNKTWSNLASGSGYRKPPGPKSCTVEDLIKDRDKPEDPEPKTAEGKRKKRYHLYLMDHYAESYVSMTFIFLVGKIYVRNGDVVAYKDFRNYRYNHRTKTIYYIKPGQMYVKFYSDRLYRFIRDMGRLKIPRKELMPRLVWNSVLFCHRTGDKEIRSADGKTRYIPEFEAIGVMTEYYRNYKKWKSNTVAFATSDKKLYKKIQEAEKTGY